MCIRDRNYTAFGYVTQVGVFLIMFPPASEHMAHKIHNQAMLFLASRRRLRAPLVFARLCVSHGTEILRIVLRCLIPVSYTHLDVYKRQP